MSKKKPEELTVSDLFSGVYSILNTDHFPVEGLPSQGIVTVYFKSGASVDLKSNRDEFERIVDAIELQGTNN